MCTEAGVAVSECTRFGSPGFEAGAVRLLAEANEAMLAITDHHGFGVANYPQWVVRDSKIRTRYSVASQEGTAQTDPMSEIDISPLDPETASDTQLAEVHDLAAAVHTEALPDDPYQPLALSLVEYRRTTPKTHRRWWVARRRGVVVGHGTASWDDVPDNRNHAWLNVRVAPSARRAGTGAALFRLGLDAAEGWGADLIDCYARAGGPADGFLRRLGADLRIVERESVCPTAEIDADLLSAWVRRARERAATYSLVAWDGPCPDEHIDAFVALAMVMNTAPRGDLELDDWVLTPERLREHETVSEAQGHERWTVCARHDDSGEFAGYTEIMLPSLWPEIAYQGDTGVWPKHRDRGLGRWLKASVALRLLAERPRVTRIETENAESNRAMLGINEAMGFRPRQNWGGWQVPLDRARAALA